MIYTLTPGADGYLTIRGTYKPGDVIQLKGNFKAVAIYDLAGNATTPIQITNVPNEVLTIGDVAWSRGAWPHGLAVRNSKHLSIFGTTKENFKITGSNSTAKNTNGDGLARAAYFNLLIGELSDNIKVYNMTIANGGTGIWCKTEVTKDERTWFPNTYLENFEFYDLEIYNTVNEAMYIGHTATYWNITTNAPLYTTPPAGSGAYIKQPIKLRNVKMHHNYIHDTYTDGIQASAIDNLIVTDNEVANWAQQKDSSHNGGILIGGRVKDFEVTNNYVHDGWGEMLQVYAEAGKAIVKNNLFVRNKISGISLRGTNNLAIEFTNNTVAYAGDHAVRVNGAFGGTGKNILKSNLFVQPTSGRDVYLENNGQVTQDGNKVFAKAADAKLDETKYFAPFDGSPAAGIGYVRPGTTTPPEPEPPVNVPAVITISSDLLASLLKAIKPGDYTFALEVKDKDGVKKVAAKITIS